MFRATVLAVTTLLLSTVPLAAAEPPPPNVIIVYADDLGYGDLGCYGAKGYATPNLDRLAREGVRFTDFYVAQAVCSASRTALLTGCYPNRLGILGALNHAAKIGISDKEMTLGQLLKQRGYATAAFGKWHLGYQPKFLPTHHGFDEYFGLPYSNDMRQPPVGTKFRGPPLIEGDAIFANDPDQQWLTTWYTDRAVRFIARNKDRPFFLYLAHTMPHVPLAVSPKFKGTSARGLYGDVLMEIDWSVGQILGELQKHGLEGRTLVIFASDNGPWLTYGEHAGLAGPLREGKATAWEGGVRVPCVMRWPGQIPAGTVCREPAMTIDIFPTLARLSGAPLPTHKIDGLDIWPLVSGQPGAKCPHEAFYFYWGNALQAVRSGPWKLHLPHDYPTLAGQPGGRGGRPGKLERRKTELALYDLDKDVGETTDVAAQHPDVVERLKALAAKAREDLGDSTVKQKGKGVRPPGSL